jgi:hypothetical protein
MNDDDEYYEDGGDDYEGGDDDEDKDENEGDEEELVGDEEEEAPAEEEQKFVASAKQFELAGGGIRSDVNLKSVKNPQERFRIIVAGVANRINDVMKEKPFSRDDFTRMTDKVAVTPFIQYKNPSAFVLGYYATRGGRENMTPALFQKVLAMLNVINETKEIASPPDIIRYATFWREVLK